MANINLSGVLRDPLGEVSYGNTVKFTHETTTGETIGGFASALIVEINGSYDIDLEYGNVLIESYDKINSRWIKHGTYTINSETPATSLPELIGVTNPLTEPELLIVQNLVTDAAESAEEALNSANEVNSLFDNFDSNVSLSIGTIKTNLSFHAPINDSLAIIIGYGTNDTIEVNGSTISLPSKSIDFSCPSVRSVINKSGITQSVIANEAAIGGDGAWFHVAYTNEALNSGDPSQWDQIVGSSVVGDFGISQSESSGYVRHSDNYSLIGEDSVGIQFKLKKENAIFIEVKFIYSFGGSVSLPAWIVLNLETGEVYESPSFISLSGAINFIKKVDEGYLVMDLKGDCGIEFNSQAVQFRAVSDMDSGSYSGDGVSVDYYVKDIQILKNLSDLPFIETGGASVSVAKTISSIPIMNNFPTVNYPFCIEIDCKIPIYSGAESTPFRNVFMTSGGANLTPKLALRRNSNGSIAFYAQNSSGAVVSCFAQGFESVSEFKKYSCRYDGERISLFIEGVKEAEATVENVYYDVNDNLLIGSNGISGNQLNSQIKTINIHHGMVSDDSIASWGGYK